MITNLISILFMAMSWLNAGTSIQKKTTATIDTEHSIIRWKGTKMLYTGSHEGTIKFTSGQLVLDGDQIADGYFVVDMNTIEITDIPLHEPVPRNNLKKHLEEDFDVLHYPTATLSILKCSLSDEKFACRGRLTIKGITREILFNPGRTNSGIYSASLTIRRDDFSIGEDGSWLEKRLVDQEIKLSVELYINQAVPQVKSAH